LQNTSTKDVFAVVRFDSKARKSLKSRSQCFIDKKEGVEGWWRCPSGCARASCLLARDVNTTTRGNRPWLQALEELENKMPVLKC
jgi:hypothetical protein